jgi:UDP-N-acetyl-D-glucosamine dehydrogenase
MEIEARIADRSAIVGVIGLGYVGLPLLATFHAAGFRVIGFDVDPAKPAALLRGEVYLKHLGNELAQKMVRGRRFDATTDTGRYAECDALISCVPTPLGKHLEPDLTYIERCADDIGRTLRRGQLIVLESSTYPGTTRQVMLPRLERIGLRCGEDFFLAYSPEREDPGRKEYTTQTIPKLVRAAARLPRLFTAPPFNRSSPSRPPRSPRRRKFSKTSIGR